MDTDDATHGNESPYAVVDAKLGMLAEALPTPPPWYDGWVRLGPDATEEQRLVVYRAVRESGLLPEAASF